MENVDFIFNYVGILYSDVLKNISNNIMVLGFTLLIFFIFIRLYIKLNFSINSDIKELKNFQRVLSWFCIVVK